MSTAVLSLYHKCLWNITSSHISKNVPFCMDTVCQPDNCLLSLSYPKTHVNCLSFPQQMSMEHCSLSYKQNVPFALIQCVNLITIYYHCNGQHIMSTAFLSIRMSMEHLLSHIAKMYPLHRYSVST